MEVISLLVGAGLMWPSFGLVMAHADGEKNWRDLPKTLLLAAVALGLFVYGALGIKNLPTGNGGYSADSGICGSGPTSYDC